MNSINKVLYKHKIVTIFILFSFIFSLNIYAKNIKELLDVLKNKTASMQYSYFVANNNAFLATGKNGSYSVWLYTSDRKWKPISNAGEFDGFAKADKVFDNVSIHKANGNITFGNIINNTALREAKYIENKTLDIGWYFWVTNGDAFLLKPRNDNEVSIWHYTRNRKWQPIYNTSAFDNFPHKPKTFDNIIFKLSTLSVEIGAINPKYDIESNKILPRLDNDENENHENNDNENDNDNDNETNDNDNENHEGNDNDNDNNERNDNDRG